MTAKAEILHDDDPMSPRDWDNLGTMACWHRNYMLGDEQPTQDPGDYIREACPEGSIVINLNLYDHSGISMSTGNEYPFDCKWDAGWVGFIYVTLDTIRKEYGDTSKESVEKARKCLESEVRVYDEYLTGNVWGFVIVEETTCGECKRPQSKDIDSCFGFFGGDLEGMKHHVDEQYHELFDEAWDNRFS